MTGIRDLQTMFGAVGQAQSTRSSAVESKGAMQTSTSASGNIASGGETIVVSSTAGALAQVSEQSDVRQEKVDALKAAINNGTYNVSSADVADKLISLMKGGQ